MPRQADCRSRLTVDDGGVIGRARPDEMSDPSKQAPVPGVNSAIVPIPLDSSLQHSYFRQLTNSIQDVQEVTTFYIVIRQYHHSCWHVRIRSERSYREQCDDGVIIVITSGYATWFTAGGAIRIAHYDVVDDVITRKL